MRKTILYLLLLMMPAFSTACTKTPIDNGGGGGGGKDPDPGNYEEYTSGNIVATDALGRSLPDAETVGRPRSSRFVGMFYWTWHYHHSSQAQGSYPKQIVDISKVLAEDPSAGTPAGLNNPKWPSFASHNYLWWGEPLFDYYITTDKWVIRKHAEMLAMAGVDVIFFDLTNGGFTFPEGWQAVFETFKEAQDDGVDVPKIGFFMGFAGNGDTHLALTDLYNKIYSKGLYSDLWFEWKGKPLILGYPQTAQNWDIRNFFTFRPGQASYNVGPEPVQTDPSEPEMNQWGWLQIYPQHGFGAKANGRFEQMPVGVAQNWANGKLNPMNHPQAYGRSYTAAKGFNTDPDAVNWGLNYQEQWDRALTVDPEFVFITGWNEWLAGRAAEWGGDNIVNAFPDLYNQEYSRDIEPMKGGHGDNYYMQTVQNIRKFKGVEAPAKAPVVTGFAIDGDRDKWDALPAFGAYRGNTFARNSKAYDHRITYTNNTGRNDIVAAKVAVDDQNVYFYAEVAGTLSPETDDDWMYLLINSDRDRSTGWEGYDYILNRTKPSEGKAVLESSLTKNWSWVEDARVDYSKGTNWIEIAVPRRLIGQDKGKLSLEFKWVDNMQEKGNILDFYVNGDSAPTGRFNYLVIE